jgi:energy-converting hydrogenase Eha subunit B
VAAGSSSSRQVAVIISSVVSPDPQVSGTLGRLLTTGIICFLQIFIIVSMEEDFG